MSSQREIGQPIQDTVVDSTDLYLNQILVDIQLQDPSTNVELFEDDQRKTSDSSGIFSFSDVSVDETESQRRNEDSAEDQGWLIDELNKIDPMSLKIPTHIPEGGFSAIRQPSPLYQENEFQYYKPKRCSSLKNSRADSGKQIVKAVRFADAFGLDLATVKTVFNNDSPPKIPDSAILDLKFESKDSLETINYRYFQMCFAQPNASPLFNNRVLVQTVCLESVQINSLLNTLTGLVRVKNLGFEKRVYARLTYDKWKNFFEVTASYVSKASEGNTDKFRFTVSLPDNLEIGEDLQFAVCYQTHTGDQFWDNNFGQNYRVMCCVKHVHKPGEFGWGQYM